MKKGNAALYILIAIIVLSLAAFLFVKNSKRGLDNTDSSTIEESTDSGTEQEQISEETIDGIEPNEKPEEQIPKDNAVIGGSLMDIDKTIPDNIKASGAHGILMEMLKAASLIETLQGDGPFTIFAPTNESFNNMPEGTLSELVKAENKTDLIGILSYHIVPGKYTSADLTEGLQLETVSGQILTFNKKEDIWVINSTAKVIAADGHSSNGVLHSIDAVLLPPN